MVNERSTQSVKELRNYQWLNRNVTSGYLEMGFVVDSILFDMQFRDIPIPPQQKYLNKLKDHVKVIISNLYDVYNSDPEQYVGYLRRSGEYKRKRGIKGFQFGYQNVRKVTDFLRVINVNYYFRSTTIKIPVLTTYQAFPFLFFDSSNR